VCSIVDSMALTLSVPPSLLSESCQVSPFVGVFFFSLFATALDMALRLKILELAMRN